MAPAWPGALAGAAWNAGTESRGLGSQLPWSFSSPTPTTPHRVSQGSVQSGMEGAT